MRFEQTQDVLNHVGNFHRQASLLFRTLNEKASNQRVRMLLDYLARHEDTLAKNVAEFRNSASPQVLNSWFKYTHDEDIFAPILATDGQADMPFDAVVELAFGLDEKLLELYREMAERARALEVKDIFNSLLLQELQEKRKLMHSALGLMDL